MRPSNKYAAGRYYRQPNGKLKCYIWHQGKPTTKTVDNVEQARQWLSDKTRELKQGHTPFTQEQERTAREIFNMIPDGADPIAIVRVGLHALPQSSTLPLTIAIDEFLQTKTATRVREATWRNLSVHLRKFDHEHPGLTLDQLTGPLPRKRVRLAWHISLSTHVRRARYFC